MRKREINIWNFDEPTRGEIDLRKIQNELYTYMDARFTLRDVYSQIQAKTCPLSKGVREYVLSHFDKDGNFINQ